MGAGLFGLAISAIPSPHDVLVFWVGNFSSPWAVIAFFAGWAQRSAVRAAVAGAMVGAATVVGFSASFLTLDPARLGLPPSTPRLTVLEPSVVSWTSFTAFCLAIAVAAGLGYGSLGAWWARSPSLLAGIALALPFLAEPWIWPLYTGHYQGPVGMWVGETAAGVCVLGLAVSGDEVRTAHQIRTRRRLDQVSYACI